MPVLSITRRHFLRELVGTAAWYAQTKGLLDDVRTRAEWAKRREKILAQMQLVMGPLPAKKKLPVEMIELERVEQPGFTRTRITFLSEEDDRLPAYLLVPQG